MANSSNTGRRRIFSSRRIAEILGASILAALLTAIIGNLPKFELVEAAINDDNFTDLVQKTRGDLPIDSRIMVVTYDETILDSFDMVDRSALAMQLAALLELKPHVVGVDFLIETERPESPDGDAMLASLISDHPELIFGIFYEDSLRRFRIPPPRFNLRPEQLGCINVKEDDDRTIRTFTRIWGEEDSLRFESFDVRLARRIDSGAAAYLASFSEDEFVIDYAAGIGETRSSSREGERIFPVLPLRSIFDAMMAGDTAALRFLRSQFQGKAVLVGYGDIGNTQVTRIVDRFYTPLKEGEKNTLPDMHGVAIHANILNTILQQRIVQVVPLWINLLWGTALVLVLLAGREALQSLIPDPRRRAALSYSGFALLFLLGAFLPILAFRYTPYKFSIYTSLAGLLLAVPTLEGLERGINLLRDLRRRRRLRGEFPPEIRSGMLEILSAWSTEERMERAVHFLQRQFHTACAILFHEGGPQGVPLPQFSHTVIAAPSLPRILASLNQENEEPAPLSPPASRAAGLLMAMHDDPLLQRTLRFSRSLYIALNEIRRQSQGAAFGGDETGTADERTEFAESVGEYSDLALQALGSRGTRNAGEEFQELYGALERYAVRAAEILRKDDGTIGDIQDGAGDLHPFIFPCRCQLHLAEERFVYFGEQEDTNNRDDFFDLVYAGRTIRCQPESHPGLTKFRELTGHGADDKERQEE